MSQIQSLILTLDEWTRKFSDNPQVSDHDKEAAKEFKDTLQHLDNFMEEVTHIHENKSFLMGRLVFSACVDFEESVKSIIAGFCDQCCIEDERVETLERDAINNVYFDNPPPGDKFFKGFFNNVRERSNIVRDIKEWYGLREDILREAAFLY